MYIDNHFFLNDKVDGKIKGYYLYEVEMQVRIENTDMIGNVDPERVGKCLKAASKAFQEAWKT